MVLLATTMFWGIGNYLRPFLGASDQPEGQELGGLFYLFIVSISYQMKMIQSISRTDPIMKLSQLVVHMGPHQGWASRSSFLLIIALSKI